MPSNITSDQPVLIIGAGIAGLTLAQGLRLHSIPFRLFERHPQSRGLQGHRFRISGDGKAALTSVLSPQLQDLLQRTASDNARFEPRYVDSRKLEFANPTPVGDSMPVDRTWLRALTSLHIDEAIKYDMEFESYEVVDGHVEVKFTDGSIASGRLLVGADGVRSRVRKQLQPNRKLLDLERWVSWSRTPLTEDLRKSLSPDVLTWCMYVDHESNVQMIAEPMTWSESARLEPRGKLPDIPDYVYWVICTAPFQYSDGLPRADEEKKAFLEKVSKTWHPTLKLLIESAAFDLSACIPVFSSKPNIEMSSTGQTGRVTLIGDAAHAMSPIGGAGGDTAMRNAADLAHTIAREGVTKASMSDFEARMQALAKEKIEHSFRGGQKFWSGKEWSEYNEIDD
ncbi:FAD/NAD(P)-binding domain-containing protein [Hypoxylon fragiforme]|uniref:FAD/NAD(P)-binding domain-containing protein n=1 Tax=Hypoxylon fragiforme TaxID=63214 RepID=UPI0020C6CAF2|nr:FAD/NAD(P)-binding domain-containing protein [Hypoxylon fragiforme]KAI2603353.1 FAD/NAD(P)-binding domain-containing protein [Hypoxylon fragiforme]